MFKQQVRSQILFSILISAAVPIVCSAQSLNDGYEFRQSGVYRQIASLQNAVQTRTGPAPIYATDDTTGKTSCIWNCDGLGENGQNPLVHKVMVMGRDERNDAGAFLSAEMDEKYSNKGRIECPIPGMPRSLYISTGWAYGAADTIVSNSHAFYIEPHPPSQPNEIILSPSTCSFVTYDRSGVVRDSVPISYAHARWDNPKLHGDRSQDIAAVKLSRAPNHAMRWPPLGNGRTLNGSNIMFIGFHNDVPNNKIARVTRGQIYPMQANGAGEFGYSRISDYRRMFVTNVDVNHGSSGGMYIDVDSGAAVGIQVGASSMNHEESGEFDIKNQIYNYGVYFDTEFINEMRALARTPNASKSI